MEMMTSTGGTMIAYQRSGMGPPLVLVHGTTADHTRWAPVLPAFEQHFTVYGLDRRGRGGSGDAEQYAIEREFEDIVALVNSIFLLGHSYGAYTGRFFGKAITAGQNDARASTSFLLQDFQNAF